MKKSELIYKVQHILDNLENVCSNKLKSEFIVSEIEKVGMLPPITTKLKNYDNVIECVENVNEWEEEK